MRVCSVNVTALTRARLEAVLKTHAVSSAQFIVLQETRHANLKPKWAEKLAEAYGFGIAFSKPPDRGHIGRGGWGIMHGGTAVAWRRGVGRVSIHRAENHRGVAVKTRVVTVASAYGPAQGPDIAWFDSSQAWLNQVAGIEGNIIIWAGDFSWKKAYETLTAGDWCAAPAMVTTTTAGTHPSRCLTRGTTAECTDAVAVASVSYHKLLTYEVKTEIDVKQMKRLKNTAKYEWLEAEVTSKEESEEIRAEVDKKLPLQRGAPLLNQWQCFHARLEALSKKRLSWGWQM